jgi:uncharacterized LabA/DUF88 family protein
VVAPNIRARAFVDYWNFKLDWRKRAAGRMPDWVNLHNLLLENTNDQISKARAGGAIILETRIYGGFVQEKDDGELRELEVARDISAGLILRTVRRKTIPRTERCRTCHEEFRTCRNCHAKFTHVPEKGIDAWIVTDLMQLAWEDAFDLAVLVSSDLDFIPVVDVLQNKGFRIIHAGWKGHAKKLGERCWARIDFTSLTRTERALAEVQAAERRHR